jgi:hypothetical protein
MAISAHDRKTVAERAGYCCEYCRSQLKFSADSFSVEHVIPRSCGGSEDLSNLALSCQRCNNAKFVATEAVDPLTGAVARLFHPREHDWAEHFAWSSDYLLIHGLTPIGRATVDRLQLNRPGVVNLRRILRDAGEHPPHSA